MTASPFPRSGGETDNRLSRRTQTGGGGDIIKTPLAKDYKTGYASHEACQGLKNQCPVIEDFLWINPYPNSGPYSAVIFHLYGTD
jgi:hypothetical protein